MIIISSTLIITGEGGYNTSEVVTYNTLRVVVYNTLDSEKKLPITPYARFFSIFFTRELTYTEPLNMVLYS